MPWLNAVTSPERPAVMLPPRPPTLTITRLLPAKPALARHCVDVSDSQLLRAHPVPPTLTALLWSASPSLAPATVSIAEPVTAPLPLSIMLTPAGSAVTDTLALPTLRPADSARRPLPDALCVTKHRADESDIHVVRSHADRPSSALAVFALWLSPEPCTVRLVDPVRAALLRSDPLTIPTPPAENACVRLHARQPEVTPTRRLPNTTAPPAHRNDVSDTHAVISLTVRPTEADTEKLACPSPAPRTVTAIHPVAAPLTLCIPLSATESPLHAMLALPTDRPVDIASRRLRRLPCPKRHRVDVSDTHDVRSHPVYPERAPPVAPLSPSPAPCTVMLADPVPAALARRIPLPSALPEEKASLLLPSLLPSDTVSRRLPIPAAAARHVTDVADTHPLCSMAVHPVRARALWERSPRFPPCSVKLADPEPATFARPARLTPPRSADRLALRLPCRCKAVTMAALLPAAPCTAWHRSDVSDSHDVAWQADPAIRTTAVGSYRPRLDPRTVRLADPVPAALDRNTVLSAPVLAESPADTLPASTPTDIATLRLPRSAPAPRQPSAVSDTHRVCSQPVCPSRVDAEKALPPIPAP